MVHVDFPATQEHLSSQGNIAAVGGKVGTVSRAEARNRDWTSKIKCRKETGRRGREWGEGADSESEKELEAQGDLR